MRQQRIPLDKRCGMCGQYKPLTEFHVRNKAAGSYGARCKVCVREYQRVWTEQNRERVRETLRRHKRRHPDRKAARDAISKAVARGNMVRPTQCDRCGVTTDVEGHHADYAKRHDVEWLCKRCHEDEHHGVRGGLLRERGF